MKLNTTWLIFLCALMLMTTGVVMVYSSSAAVAAREEKDRRAEQPQPASETQILTESAHSAAYLKKQALWALMSVAAMLLAYQIDHEKYKKFSKPILFGTFILLLMVFLPPPIGKVAKGSHRWINLGITQLQVSELAKLSLILFMAKKLSEMPNEVRSFSKGFLPAVTVLALFMVAIVLEPDLGAAVMIGAIVFVMMYVAGMRMIHLCTLGIAAMPCLMIAIIIEPYRIRRLFAYIDPEADIRGKGWQLFQSLISVSTGGIHGLGLGEGPQKYAFLAEAHTDFIYAVICEELGMIGALVVFALYAFFMIQAIRVASRAPDLYGSLIATGITAMIGLQAFVNMYVVTGLLPTKGLTLPLISYGGSSLLINCIGIGILMNVSRYTEIAATPARRAAAAYA